jgi:hypothetical protein
MHAKSTQWASARQKGHQQFPCPCTPRASTPPPRLRPVAAAMFEGVLLRDSLLQVVRLTPRSLRLSGPLALCTASTIQILCVRATCPALVFVGAAGCFRSKEPREGGPWPGSRLSVGGGWVGDGGGGLARVGLGGGFRSRYHAQSHSSAWGYVRGRTDVGRRAGRALYAPLKPITLAGALEGRGTSGVSIA